MKTDLPTDPVADPRFAPVLALLRAAPAPTPSTGFADRVCAAATRRRPPRPAWLPALLRAAAALVLLLGAALWLRRASAPAPVAANPAPLDILLAAQRPDGAWSADPARTRPRYDPGVTALALLALVHHDGNPLATPNANAFSAGVASLLRTQRPDGRFAPPSHSASASDYLAIKALQAARALPGAPAAWTDAFLRARPHLPRPSEVAPLNRFLARPAPPTDPWLVAAGPAAQAALSLLHN